MPALTALQRATSLASDLDCAVGLIQLFDKYLPGNSPDDRELAFHYKNSYYNIRHHVLAIDDLLASARDEMVMIGVKNRFESLAQGLKEKRKYISEAGSHGASKKARRKTVREEIADAMNESILGNVTQAVGKKNTSKLKGVGKNVALAETVDENNQDTISTTSTSTISTSCSEDLSGSLQVSAKAGGGNLSSLAEPETRVGNEKIPKTYAQMYTGIIGRIDDSIAMLLYRKDRLGEYITAECPHFFVQEMKMVVPWEGNIIFNRQRTIDSEVATEISQQIGYLENDIKLARETITYLDNQMTINPSLLSEHRKITFVACKATLDSLAKCKDKLAKIVEKKLLVYDISYEQFNELVEMISAQKKKLGALYETLNLMEDDFKE